MSEAKETTGRVKFLVHMDGYKPLEGYSFDYVTKDEHLALIRQLAAGNISLVLWDEKCEVCTIVPWDLLKTGLVRVSQDMR